MDWIVPFLVGWCCGGIVGLVIMYVFFLKAAASIRW